MAAAAKRQDMPPPGGYSKINYERIPAKKFFSGYTMFAAATGIFVGASYLYYLTLKERRRDEVEMRSSRFALYPLLLAERDREFLKQLRRNRDEEAELMKNVKGWEVGTLWGEPIYKTLPPDTFVEPIELELYAHTSYKEYAKRANARLWC